MRDRRHLLKGADKLADFTDCLLEGQTADDAIPAADRDLAQLIKTVEFVNRAGPTPRDPEPALKNRIRANLSAKWHLYGPAVQDQQRGWRSSRQKTQTLILRYAVIAVLVAFVAGLVAPQFETVLPGAAQSQGIASGIVLVLMAVVGLIFFFSSRRKS